MAMALMIASKTVKKVAPGEVPDAVILFTQ